MVIGVYPRKLFFFALIFAFALLVVRYQVAIREGRLIQANTEVEADIVLASPDDNYNTSSVRGEYLLNIELLENGSLKVANREVREGIKAREYYDELRYIILNKQTEYYSQAKIIIDLPKPVVRLVEDPQIIAVHGASASGAYISNDGSQIIYGAKDISSGSTVTVVAYFPKGYFDLPINKVVEGGVESVPPYIWVILALVFPLISAVIIVSMFARRGLGGLPRNLGSLARLPENIPPAVIAALVEGKVRPRAIMATLIDLANRGYIDIYNRGSDFVIYKKTVLPEWKAELLPFELMLLDKIFLPSQQSVDTQDVEERASRHLFSRKIALIYLDIYQYASDLGFFSEPPARLHLKYRLAGIIMFFFGLAGYILFAIFGGEPKVLLLLWLVLISEGMVIVKLAPSITNYTLKGRRAVIEWHRFRNFLSLSEPYRGDEGDFLKYLPYAISLGVEASWSARFVQSNFILPKWYDAIVRIDGIENFAKSLLPVIDYIADTLNLSSEPLVR